MLIMASIINHHPKADTSKFFQFVDFFRRQGKGDVFDKEEQNEYSMRRKQLRKYTISVADVIIITVSNIRDTAIYSVFKPHFIVVDKAN